MNLGTYTRILSWSMEVPLTLPRFIQKEQLSEYINELIIIINHAGKLSTMEITSIY